LSLSSVQYNNNTEEQQELRLIYLKDPKEITSSDILKYDQWPTLSLYYKLDIFKLYHKGYNAILPDSLSENILKLNVAQMAPLWEEATF